MDLTANKLSLLDQIIRKKEEEEDYSKEKWALLSIYEDDEY